MQLIKAQGADNDNLAVVIITAWRRAFGQAGVGGLHQDNFICGDASDEDAPQIKKRAREHHGECIALTGAESLAIAGGFSRVCEQV